MQLKYFKYFLILVSLNCFGQKTMELSTDYYSNGNLHWKGYNECQTYKLGYKSCSSIGQWNYWYENGNKEKETFDDRSGVKYINMWLPDGKQIMENGQGILVEVDYWTGRNQDSIIYEITDSIKQGAYNRYRTRDKKNYYWIESGQYKNGLKEGQRTFRDSILNIYEQDFFINGENNGPYRLMYLNGKTKEEGQNFKYRKFGNWKYYDENGKLIKERNFIEGYEFGKYVEYFTNGKIKVDGQFMQVGGYENNTVENPETGEMKTSKSFNPKISGKCGVWRFYNEDGKLLKEKKYKN